MSSVSPGTNRTPTVEIGVAPVDGGFTWDDHWVWCGSVTQDDDGLYHMFASVWEKTVAFAPNWLTNSRVVRAVSETVEGPYRYAGEVLPVRGPEYWDGMMTHNPTIHRHGDTWLLFYTGTTYDGAQPGPDLPPLKSKDPQRVQARGNQRIGLATAPHPSGPWTRLDAPVLDVRPGQWDAFLTTNAAPCVSPDGRVLLLYKSTADDRDILRYGVSGAEHWSGPYKRLKDEPVNFMHNGQACTYEDATVFLQDDGYHMFFNDLRGVLTGEDHAGAHAISNDGIEWRLAPNPKAYSRHVRWSDGRETVQGSFERPQIFLQDGKPSHLFAATADGPGGFSCAENTWNMVVPCTFV